MKQAKGDIHIALQAYNMGNGFIGYALERGGYSKEVAIDFSEMMANKNGWARYGASTLSNTSFAIMRAEMAGRWSWEMEAILLM
ncbi:lysozyme family protein [Fictibacillus terranigra]|uniref:Lysozyme family protein n=1 Tax=Fictibacillus terranigra TaxID=3058424 RepID=A0ABT8EC50_9BACL|nr:lysozyme family protein [Fictibacillus sp. CENA-BCM004]MDN4075510.1 lysozyme family protein [Fictibacillus sp. CENA-BCM004]